jgi:thiol-disulfide isomerase/thioredoxin
VIAATTLISLAVACGSAGGAERAPEFRLNVYGEVGGGGDGGARTVKLSDFRGSPVVVNFWAVWCSPCRTEMPALETVYRRHRHDGLVVLGVDMGAVDPTGAQAREFLAEVGVTYPVGAPESTRTGPEYGVTGLPTTVFIDPNGALQSRYVGPIDEAELDRRVSELIP